MGQCLSSAASGRAASEEPALQAGVHDRLIHPPVPAANGSEAVVSQAKLSVDGGPAVPLLVRSTPHHVFVALFEGLGEDRRSVAAFCRARVWEAYTAAAAAHPGSPLEALKDTLARLDAAVLATDRLRPAVGGLGGCWGLDKGACRVPARCVNGSTVAVTWSRPSTRPALAARRRPRRAAARPRCCCCWSRAAGGATAPTWAPRRAC